MDMIGERQAKSISSEMRSALKLKAVKCSTQSGSEIVEPNTYDYMKYPTRKKAKGLHGHGKSKKCVSFKRVVELVTFTDDWKMQTSESCLRTEDEQRKCTNLKRNF